SIGRALSALRAAKAELAADIRAYPTPIAGCDAQFNYLLAERQRISAAIGVLGEEVFIPTPRTPSANAGVESR
ncbi:MAG: hypothetical protein AAGF50_09675, partial [Pseudomonadota bacterium]